MTFGSARLLLAAVAWAAAGTTPTAPAHSATANSARRWARRDLNSM